MLELSHQEESPNYLGENHNDITKYQRLPIPEEISITTLLKEHHLELWCGSNLALLFQLPYKKSPIWQDDPSLSRLVPKESPFVISQLL